MLALTIPMTARADTDALAHKLAVGAFPGMVLLLSGNLGSGKTTFMQAFGRGLGITETITSPTFTLIDEYHEGRLPLYHMDLYRLEPNQTRGLHLAMYWQGKELPLGVVAIEWPERLPHFPAEYLHIKIDVVNESHDLNAHDPNLVPANETGLDQAEMLEEILDLPQGRIFELSAVGQKYQALISQLGQN
ncbi:MAG: tRNA (adenosine(37)-N6)-threonylcarbamoyltransferase complex ATPase subunit type 1 TsaE [Pseudanabaena sp. ELA607]